MNLQSDNIAIRLMKMLAGFAVIAVLLLSTLTIVFSFHGRVNHSNATAHVESCVDKGPVSWRGFGHNWKCTFTVQDDKTGDTWKDSLDFNFFTPDDIGTPQRITWGESRVSEGVGGYNQTDGLPSGVDGWIDVAAIFIFIFPTLWVFSRSVVWSFPQEEQRKFWEKIYGTPEERAAKKEKDGEFYRQLRQNRADRKDARRNGQRKPGKDPKKAARKRMRELKRQRD